LQLAVAWSKVIALKQKVDVVAGVCSEIGFVTI
jgi:hypothetical protein